VASDPARPRPDPQARNEAWRAEVEERAVLEAPEAATLEAVAPVVPEAAAPATPEAVAVPTGRAVVRPPASQYHAAGVESLLLGPREDMATSGDATAEEAVTSRPRSAGQERKSQQQRERTGFPLRSHHGQHLLTSSGTHRGGRRSTHSFHRGSHRRRVERNLAFEVMQHPGGGR
jgi:hypothetical protein